MVGKGLTAEDRVPGSVPVYGSSGIVGYHHKPLATGPAIILGRKGNVGSVWWSATDFWPIDTVFFVDAGTSNPWLYFALQNTGFISTDVAVPGLNRDFAYSREILFPVDSVLRNFVDLVTPMFLLIQLLNEQNEKLVGARDLLLPRLITGDLAV